MTVSLTYDSTLSRVRVSLSDLPSTSATALVERSTDGVKWSTVRGGSSVALVDDGSGLGTMGTGVPLDDYEFSADVSNTYRVTAYDGGGVQVAQETAASTPVLASPWLKVIARPFLNRPVTILDHGDIKRPSRGGAFPVVGRTLPVVVSDVRGSRQFELQLVTFTATERENMDYALAAGEPVFLHVPAAGCPVPGGYYHVGDSTESQPSRKSERRIFELPVTEIAAPGPEVVGASVTWQTVLSTYATWQDVLDAHATWSDVLELVGDPADVIVP